ncbi:MAG: histidine kinase [Lewinellaceae bacterium]|nr:histidine kinase [Lewinellaceae bacterium]
MVLRLATTILALGIWANSVFAQIPSFNLKRYDDVPELANVQISRIFPDSKGFLWIAADAGLLRFDGSSFIAFRNDPNDSSSLAYNHVICLTEDKNSNLWAGLNRGGVSMYNRKTGKFRNFPVNSMLTPNTTPVVGIFADADGMIWISAAGNGLIRLDPATGKTQQYDIVTRKSAPHLDDSDVSWTNQAYQFWQDSATQRIWLVTRDGLYTLDPHSGKTEPKRSPVYNYSIPGTYNMYDIAPDGDNFWIGGWESGLKRVNRYSNEHKIYFYDKNPSPTHITNIVNAVIPLNSNLLWVCTAGKGTLVFDKHTEQFLSFNTEGTEHPGLSSGESKLIVKDKQGNFWLTVNNVLTQITLDNTLFQSKNVIEEEGISASVRDVCDDRNGRYTLVATQYSEGVKVIDRQTGETYFMGFKNPPGRENIMVVMGIRQAPDGRFWVLTRARLFYFDPATKSLKIAVQPGDQIPGSHSVLYTFMEIDKKGWLWIGSSYDGLFHYDPQTGASERFQYKEDDPTTPPAEVAGVVAVDGKGRCWMGSMDKTFYGYWIPWEKRYVRLDKNGQVTQHKYSFRTNAIVSDSRGDIWVSSDAGLLHFDCSGTQPVFVKKYTLASGLSSDYIIRTAEDRQGNIWGLALRELFCLDRKTDNFTIYGKSDGYKFSSAWGIAAGNDGLMYTYGVGGTIWYFNPTTIQKRAIKPLIALVSFSADGNELYKGSEPIPQNSLQVPKDCRYFSLGFAVLDFVSPGKYEFEYMMEGIDKGWAKVGTRRNFGFTGLPSGNYVFKLKIVGSPDTTAIAIPVKVNVSFYRTSWFRFLVIFGVIAGLLYYYFARQRQQRRFAELESKTQLLEKEKAIVMYESLKQQLNPHFLFNSLTSLGSLIMIDPKAAAGFLENLSKTYRYILKSSDYDVVSLADEVKFAESFVSLQRTRFEQGFDVSFQIPEDCGQRKIVPVTLQNLLENAIKHNIIDPETPLIVEVSVEDECLVVRNNLQRKKYIETSNGKGLHHLQTFYSYLTDRAIVIHETSEFFEIRIPLL